MHARWLLSVIPASTGRRAPTRQVHSLRGAERRGSHGLFTAEEGLQLLWRQNLGLKLKSSSTVLHSQWPGGKVVVQRWGRERAASPVAWGAEGGCGEVHAGWAAGSHPPFPLVPRRPPQPTTCWTRAWLWPGNPAVEAKGSQALLWVRTASWEWLWRGACLTSFRIPAGGQSRAQALWGCQRPGVLAPCSAISGAWFSAPGQGRPTHRCPHASPGDRARAGATCGCTCQLCAPRDHTDHRGLRHAVLLRGHVSH